MKTVMIIDGGSDYVNMFLEMGYTITKDLIYADLICFTGGADVSPSMYGAKSHRTTHSDAHRDEMERYAFNNAYINGIPMVGICRGGQFLNVMSGGEMYQDVSKHCSPHTITDATTGETVYVSSTHHQMMKMGSEGILVASSTLLGTREWYESGIFKKEVSEQDIEVVYYKHTKCLCFQPHPEFSSVEYVGMRNYFKSLLERYVS